MTAEKISRQEIRRDMMLNGELHRVIPKLAPQLYPATG
jgi:hypothetical protein